MPTSEPRSHHRGEILDIKLSDIDVAEDRARDLDTDWAQALAGIVILQGLKTPISVRQVGSRYSLVAGLHRLEAFRINSSETIPASISTAATDDEARLEEVMENLGRNDLNALDRCHHLFELKRVYEKLYPLAKHGGDRGNQHTGGKRQNFPLGTEEQKQSEIFGFASSTAEKVGMSERAIRMAVAIWKGLTVASRARASGSWLARHQGNLKALSELTPAYQSQVLDLIFADPPKAGSVADAMIIIEQGRLPSHIEKKFETLGKAIKGLKDEELDVVFSAHADRLVGWLKRTGRI